MAKHRFFVPNISFAKDFVLITDPDEIHHIKDVLRLKSGDNIILFNGRGEEACAEIAGFTAKNLEVKIVFHRKNDSSKKFSIVLACAIPKRAKFETIIEKCTELNVDEIIPLKTKRTEIRLDEEKAEKKLSRYQTIAVNAAKQSGRTDIPRIHSIAEFSQALKNISAHDAAFIPHLAGERKNLVQVLNLLEGKKRAVFFIGPEGDFTPQEIALAVQAGCVPVSLGPTILKVDTAAISVAAFMNFFHTQSPASSKEQ